MKNNQFGRSMVEILGVLAIIGVLSVGGIAGYSKAMENHKMNKLMHLLSMTSVNMQNLFSNNSVQTYKYTFNHNNPVFFKNLNIIPSDAFDEENNQMIGPWGNKMEIYTLGVNYTAGNYFIIRFWVDERQCKLLMAKDYSNLGNGFIGIKKYYCAYINDDFKDHESFYSGCTRVKLPLTPEKIDFVCTRTTDELQYVEYVFR